MTRLLAFILVAFVCLAADYDLLIRNARIIDGRGSKIAKIGSPPPESVLRDGVTSIVTRNCGSSDLDIKHFFTTLERLKPGINVATLAGHNAIRIEEVGSEDRKATPPEIDRMKGTTQYRPEPSASQRVWI